MADRDRQTQRRLLWTLIATALGSAVVVEIVSVANAAAGRHSALVRSVSLLAIAIAVAALAARGLARLSRIPSDGAAAVAARERIQQLEVTNALLHRLASTPDVTALFKVLASRIHDLVPCHGVAIALSDTAHEFQVVIARSAAPGQPVADPPQSHHFLRSGTLIGAVADAGRPRVVADLQQLGAMHLDANVLASAGLRSAAMLPLVAERLNVGVLMALSKTPGGLTDTHVERLGPVADIVAVAFATQSLARALGRSQVAKDMADVLFSLSNDINGALQAIVGHCELLSRESTDLVLQRDLAMVLRQAARATEVLAQIQQLAETRLQRATSVAALLEDARLEQITETVDGATYEDLIR